MTSLTPLVQDRGPAPLEPATRAGRVLPPWASFLLRRIGVSILVVWLAYTLSFFLLYVIPGDAALARIGGDSGASEDISPEQLLELRERLGLADPLIVQYFQRLLGVVRGDLGLSLSTDRPVTGIILDALPATLTLATIGLGIAIVLGTAIALLANLTNIRWLRTLVLSLPAVGMGLPSFWLGILLISFFSFGLRILPAGGNDGVMSLILPAVTLAIVPAATIAQVFGSSLHDTLDQAYAGTTAPAKGAGRTRVILSHCARNAAIPALTVAGLIVGNLFAGSVLIETVFSRSGVGRTMLDAVQSVDLTVVQGIVLFGAVTFVVVNLAVDLAYPLIDPRLRRTTARSKRTAARA